MTKKEYIILLPNDKTRTYRFITMFILLINVVALGSVYMNAADEKTKTIAALGGMISLVSLIIALVNFYTKKASSYRSGISFIFLSITWFLFDKYLFAISVLCFAVIGFFVSKKFRVIFSADKITYPSFPVKTFLWNMLW